MRSLSIRRYITLFIAGCLLVLQTTTPAFAQATQVSQDVEGDATLGVARMVDLKDTTVKDGSILSASERGTILTDLAYDPQVMGVVSRDAAIIFK